MTAMDDARPRERPGLSERVALGLWPGLARVSKTRHREGLATVLIALYAGLPALATMIWLAASQPGPWSWAEDPPAQDILWLALTVLIVRQALSGVSLPFALQRWDSPARGVLARLPVWSAALLYGPALLWLDVLGALLDAWLWRRGRRGTARRRWRLAADLAWTITRDTLPALVALTVFPPLPGRSFALAGALNAGLLRAGLSALLLAPVFSLLATATGRPALSLTGLLLRLRAAAGWLRAVVVLLLADLPAASAAVLLAEADPWAYLLVLVGLLALGRVGHVATQRSERERERHRRRAGLDALAQDLLAATDEEDLPDVLARQVPPLFPEGDLVVVLFPDNRLLHRPGHPADRQSASVHAPITSLEDGTAVGSIDWRPGPDVNFSSAAFAESFLALRDLADHVSAAHFRLAAEEEALEAVAEAYQSELYAELVKAEINQAYRQVSQELAVAGQIQASFLPSELPDLPGWQLSAALEPARETSGDFYDVIDLPGGLLGLVVADVADKGIGPALYAALSRTLIRTYALEYGMDPARVLRAANRRILADTRSDLFVTVFYAVLDPRSGELAYCNAGHNPPLHWAASGNPAATALKRTALPLGLFDDADWEGGRAQLQAGDMLLIYTDGLVEAQNEQGDFFGEQKLEAAASVGLGRPAQMVEDKILAAITAFTGDAPQFDDMTLMILARET